MAITLKYYIKLFILFLLPKKLRPTAKFLYLMVRSNFSLSHSRRYKAHFKYLKEEYDFGFFFQTLNENGLRYLVLRWFEDPHFIGQKDVDILVDGNDRDKYYETISYLMTYKKTSRPPIDLYYTDDNRNPFKLYSNLLLNRIKKQQYFIPSEPYFGISILYHSIMHKHLDLTKLPPDNKYRNAAQNFLNNQDLYLNALSSSLNSLELRDIDNFLEANGYPIIEDLFTFGGMRNKEIRHYVSENYSSNVNHQLIVYLIRGGDLLDSKAIGQIQQFLNQSYNVVFFDKLDVNQIELAINSTRGGNWQPVKSGPPSYIVFIYDKNPLEVPSKHKERLPLTTNYNQLKIKDQLRRFVYKKRILPAGVHFVHGPDSHLVLGNYLKILNDNQLNEIQQVTSSY